MKKEGCGRTGGEGQEEEEKWKGREERRVIGVEGVGGRRVMRVTRRCGFTIKSQLTIIQSTRPQLVEECH